MDFGADSFPVFYKVSEESEEYSQIFVKLLLTSE